MLTTNDLMTIDPDTVTPSTTLRNVVAIMNQNGNRQLPVVEGKKLIGIITDRDVRLAVNSPLLSDEPLDRITLLDTYTVECCMTRNPKTVTPDTPIHTVARILSAYKYGALPVVDGEELIGIISVTDLLDQMAIIPDSVNIK